MTDFSKKPTPESQWHSIQRDWWKLLPICVVILTLIVVKAISLEAFNQAVWVIIGGLLFYVAIAAFWYKRPASESPVRDLFKQLAPVLVVLTALLATKQVAPDNFDQALGTMAISTVVYMLAYYTFALYYHWFVRHPAEEVHERTKALEQAAQENLDLAIKVQLPNYHLASKTLVIGSPSDSQNEMMEVLFKEVFKTSQKIDISFMGTAYGAFPEGISDRSSGFGFIDALIKHIDNCNNSNANDPVVPLGTVKLIGCSDDIYVLSVKYLALSIVNKLITSNAALDDFSLSIVYPYTDCVAAIVLLDGHGGAGKIGLISPAIGKNDKNFVTQHYPVGIVIKKVDSEPANNTHYRMKKYLDTIFSTGGPAEEWEIQSDKNLVIEHFKPVSGRSHAKLAECPDGLDALINGLKASDNTTIVSISPDSIQAACDYIKCLLGKF